MAKSVLIDLVLFFCAFVFALLLWRSSMLGKDVANPQGERLDMKQRLRQAGIVVESAVWDFWFVKISLALALPLLAAEFGLSSAPVWVFVGGLAFGVPDLWLWMKIQGRRRRIRRGLPYYFDLVSSLLRTGMTLNRSFVVASRQGFVDAHPLAEEIQLLGDELGLGDSREEVFRKLARRTGVAELDSLAAAVTVGLRSGAPMQQTLQAQADRLRYRQYQDSVLQLNQSLAVSVVPVFLCGVPLWLVLVVFPAVGDLLGWLGQ